MPNPDPPTETVDEVRDRWQERTDTFGPVYDVLLGITDPTTYAEIAELANCSPNAAKKHLDRRAEMGIARVERDARSPRYRLNDGYLEWQGTSRIARERSVEEIIDRVELLEEGRAEFESRFGTTDPTAVSVFEVDDHDIVHDRMIAVSEWQGIDRDIRHYEFVRHMAANDGRLQPA